MAMKKKTTKKLSVVTANKSAFVRQYPTMKPTDLVALAAKAGIKFSPKYVYTVRWKTAAKSYATAMGERGIAKGRSTIVSYQTDAPPKAKKAKKAKKAVPLEEPKVIALTYKSNLTRDAKGGWRVATTGPVPDSDAVVPATRNRLFKQLALEIGLLQAYALLAELRAMLVPPA